MNKNRVSNHSIEAYDRPNDRLRNPKKRRQVTVLDRKWPAISAIQVIILPVMKKWIENKENDTKMDKTNKANHEQADGKHPHAVAPSWDHPTRVEFPRNVLEARRHLFYSVPKNDYSLQKPNKN